MCRCSSPSYGWGSRGLYPKSESVGHECSVSCLYLKKSFEVGAGCDFHGLRGDTGSRKALGLRAGGVVRALLGALRVGDTYVQGGGLQHARPPEADPPPRSCRAHPGGLDGAGPFLALGSQRACPRNGLNLSRTAGPGRRLQRWAAGGQGTPSGRPSLGVEDDLGDLPVFHRRAVVVPGRIAEGEACLGPGGGRLVGHLAQALGAVV